MQVHHFPPAWVDGEHAGCEDAMDVFEWAGKIGRLWSAVPEQIRRLGLVFVVFLAAFIPAQRSLIPRDFGKHGHYRSSALEETAAMPIQYAGQTICYDCHDDVVETKSHGYHKTLACEVCHGPAAAHTEDPEEVELPAPRERGYCPICHEYVPSRPTGFPQIVSASHNPLKACISCHDPHDPVPPETPRECEACHAAIARTKAVSHHVYIECTRCHEASEEHKIDPRANRPSKPAHRDFCGGCHSKEADSDPGIPRVDLATHGNSYVCWQCHYPHLPEAQ